MLESDGFSDRIAGRELDDGGKGRGDRIIGRRLKEGFAHYSRYLEILNAVSKYGFGYMLDSVKSVNIIPKLKGADPKVRDSPRGVRLRKMFEELGPTFIKIGQILTTQPYLVPEEYLRELEELKDDVKAMPFDKVKKLVEAELGSPIDKLFKKFGEKPVGSASIGQVHRARTRDGALVAVKVQKAGSRETVMEDMRILEDMAELFGDMLGVSEVMDPAEMVAEFKRNILRELDYTLEARTIEHFGRDLEDMEDVVLPRVHWGLTTNQVLTMDFVRGTPADEVDELKKKGADTGRTAIAIGRAVARMIFVKGYFHGDLHGKNVFVRPDGKISFLDFGSAGYLDERMRDRIRLFYMAVAQEKISTAVELFLEFCGVSENKVNRSALEQDFREFLDFQKLQREGRKIDKGMNQKMAYVALKHGFAPPAQFILLERTLLQVEDVCRRLSPEFDLNQMLMPMIGEMVKDKLETSLDPVRAIKSAQDYREFMRRGPKKALSVMEKLDSGEFTVKIDTSFIDEFRTDLWRITLTMSVTVIAGVLLFMMTMLGYTIETPLLNIGVGTVPVVIIWAVAVWYLLRRWDGPKRIKK